MNVRTTFLNRRSRLSESHRSVCHRLRARRPPQPFQQPPDRRRGPSATMASTLLRRHLTRASPRIPTSSPITPSASLLASRRHISNTASLQAEPASDPSAGARSTGAKNVFDTHTVEDLHGMHASEILAETGTRKDAQMRHFTGMFGV